MIQPSRTPQTATQELPFTSASGYLALLFGLGVPIGSFIWMALHGGEPGMASVLVAVGLVLLAVLALAGLYMHQPNQSSILTLFGAYRGTDRATGLRWANPFYGKRKISLRARNLVSERLKVNDKRGNPIEIAAAIVWRVEDTARAAFDVEDFEKYVSVQAEAAVRHLAGHYAYDHAAGADHETEEVTLRSATAEVARELASELDARFSQAGIRVEDARLTHLAYAPEIAGAMLRRQQAEAVIAARQKIVHGAVSMVEMALQGLSEKNLVSLDDERKAAMVSNLLVVLCAESDVQPVVNTGTLYG
ncbi:MAG: SPFH domain-containing protein [Gammaproteobacteria bacterium]